MERQIPRCLSHRMGNFYQLIVRVVAHRAKVVESSKRDQVGGGDQFPVAGSLAERHDCHRFRSDSSPMMAQPIAFEKSRLCEFASLIGLNARPVTRMPLALACKAASLHFQGVFVTAPSVEVVAADLAAPSTTQRRYAARTSGIERFLVELLAEVPCLERVSIDDHFLDDLGADSMVVAQFCARVRTRADLPWVLMKGIYQHPSISSVTTARRPDDPVPTLVGVTLRRNPRGHNPCRSDKITLGWNRYAGRLRSRGKSTRPDRNSSRRRPRRPCARPLDRCAFGPPKAVSTK